MKELKFEVVAMKDVPEPPPSSREGKYSSLYFAIKRLGGGEKNAVRVPTKDQAELNYMRGQLRKMAKGDGLRLLSSRDAGFTAAYFWTIPLE